MNQGPVVQRVDKAIHWINLYLVDNATLIQQIVIYAVDSTIKLLNNRGLSCNLKFACINTNIAKCRSESDPVPTHRKANP